MRPLFAATVLLAACFVASAAVALQDPDEKVTATFETLGTGIVGDVTLKQYGDPGQFGDPGMRVQLHANLKGLEPNTQYAAVIYTDPNMTCGAGTSTQILTFTANPAGVATWNAKTSLTLAQIGSIGIIQGGTLAACAAVVPQ